MGTLQRIFNLPNLADKKAKASFFLQAGSLHGIVGACAPKNRFCSRKIFGSSPVSYQSVLQLSAQIYIKKIELRPTRSGAFYFFLRAQSALYFSTLTRKQI